MLELEHALLSTNKLFAQEQKPKPKLVEQTQMPRETEEIRLKATDSQVRHSARLLQTENQQTELIILHQRVVSTQQSEFRQIVELRKHQTLQHAVVKQIQEDLQAQMTAVELTGLTAQPQTEDRIQPIGQELIVALAQQMQRQEEVKQIHVALRAQKTVGAQTASTKDHRALMDQE
jgi:hypothetical protein